MRLVQRDRSRVRNYFSRREQWRLLLLVFALGVVMIVMREVRRPETAVKVGRVFSGRVASAAPGDQAAPAAAPPAIGEATTPELSTEMLATIRDNTFFREAEKDAWFELIAKLQQTPPSELASRSVGEVGYAQLVQQPDSYRGRVVTVRGTVRQVTAETPAANDLELKSYSRLVIQPSGDEVWPIFVYSLDLPADFPRGAGIAVDVTATGYFFKNQSYEWKDGIGVAPVVLVKDVARPDAAAAPNPQSLVATATTAPVVADESKSAEAAPEAKADEPIADLNQVLSLAGWNSERFGTFADDQLLTPEQQQELVALLWRLRTFDAASIAAWTRKDVPITVIAAKPSEYRGQFVRLSGRVRRLIAHDLPAGDAERLEMPRYFECDLAIDKNGGTVTILTARVPQAWLAAKELDELATVAGVFIKRLTSDAVRPQILLVAPQLAGDPFGRSVLATLGMDVGLLDGIRNHQGIPGSEREAFYQMLAAVNKVGANQLIRFAKQNLDVMARSWEVDRKADDPQRRQLAEEVLRRANDGLYSVAPLFNDADRQIGQLVVVDGLARRIVRVETGSGANGGASNNVARRLGLDHYYEMEVFTDDSQNRPLVFCVRELPAGMPMGGDLREPVRVAGFFFKSWRYRTRDAGGGDDKTGVADARGKRLIAPLLVGRGPVRLELEASEGHVAELVGGGLFLLGLIGIWAAAWWFARSDRRFRQRTAAANFSLPEGRSLDELNVPAVGEPMNISGPPSADPRQLP